MKGILIPSQKKIAESNSFHNLLLTKTVYFGDAETESYLLWHTTKTQPSL